MKKLIWLLVIWFKLDQLVLLITITIMMMIIIKRMYLLTLIMENLQTQSRTLFLQIILRNHIQMTNQPIGIVLIIFQNLLMVK